MNWVFVPAVDPPPERKDLAWWLVFSNGRLLVVADTTGQQIPVARDLGDIGIDPLHVVYLGTLAGKPCYAAVLSSDASAPEGLAFHGLRALHDRLDTGFYNVAFRALHLLEWDRNERFCNRCGTATRPKTGERAKECPLCGHVSFPRISPAVIVLVERGNHVLLARAARFPGDMYSVLAGFVEPGETLESVVEREIREETGIEVQDIRYFGSQPWPFPDSLMVAFTAQYRAGEIQVDGREILDARWFRFDQLPNIPTKLSISRSLIDWFVDKHRGVTGSDSMA
jgi:NAD+ diphosphatase